MSIYNALQFTIYFGDIHDNINKAMHCIPSNASLLLHERFKPVAQRLELEELAFLNQTHSNTGTIITDTIPTFDVDGDFLITARKNIGIGVMTADCLPVVFYDSKNHVGAIAHAGWRGTVANVASKTVTCMQKEYGTHPADVQIFFGPSAKVCCYAVDEKFIENLHSEYKDCVTTMRDGQWYIDLPQFNCLQLHNLGVDPASIFFEYNACTICDNRFFSYRRQGEQAGRQMTIIVLK